MSHTVVFLVSNIIFFQSDPYKIPKKVQRFSDNYSSSSQFTTESHKTHRSNLGNRAIIAGKTFHFLRYVVAIKSSMDTNKTLSQYHMIGGEDSVKMGQTGDPITEWRGIPSRHGREWM